MPLDPGMNMALEMELKVKIRINQFMKMSLKRASNVCFGTKTVEYCPTQQVEEGFRHRRTAAMGKSRGFGFVRFKTVEAAEKAMNGSHEMDGRKHAPLALFV